MVSRPSDPDRVRRRQPRLRTRLAPVIAIALLMPAALVSAADPFYENALQRGIDAYAKKRYDAAAEALRGAAFGLLDEPLRLVEALVYLGLAQAATGDEDGFAETVRRVASADAALGAYTGANVPDALRSAFEAEIGRRAAHLAAAGGASAAWLRTLPERRVARLEPAARRTEIGRLIAAEPGNMTWRLMAAELELAFGDAARAAAHAGAVLSADPASTRALRMRGLAHASLREWAEATADLERCDAASVDPEVAAALGCALVEQQRLDDARALLAALPPEVRGHSLVVAFARSLDPPSTPVPSLPLSAEPPIAQPVTSPVPTPTTVSAPGAAPATTAPAAPTPVGHDGAVAAARATPVPTAAALSRRGGTYVQVAALSRIEDANGVRQRIIAMGFSPDEVIIIPAASGAHRVRVGPLHGAAEITRVLNLFRSSGFPDAFRAR